MKKMLLLSPGTILDDRYEVQDNIAVGGFGATYKVWDYKDKEIRALKEYFPQSISSRYPDGRIEPTNKAHQEGFEHGKIRFIEEAEMLYHLNGLPQNGINRIVRLIDYFGANDTKYYVMEYIDGHSLYDELCEETEGLPYMQVIHYLEELCDGLEELHTKHGIFHRDISPENIMLNKDGHVQLIDFGNARNLSARKGYTVVLKVAYAPLEQYTSQGVQGAFTDVYSLAATTYHLLTGCIIPKAESRFGLGSDEPEEYAPLCEKKSEIPIQISKAIDHALELDMNNRTQSMKDFKRELGVEELIRQERLKRGIPKPYYKILKGDESGTVMYLDSGKEMTIGRSMDADIHIGINEYIGRIHCSLRFDTEEEMFYIKDFSKNGTYVNGKAIPQNQTIKVPVGAHIILANHIYEFELGVKYE